MDYEFCSGAVLYRCGEEGLRYTLVRQGSRLCGIAKGHIEKGETEEEAALREVREETGISAEIVGGFRREVEYALPNGNVKRIVFFAAKYGEGDVDAGSSEGSGVYDLTFDEAVGMITYDNMREVFREACEFIEGVEAGAGF